MIVIEGTPGHTIKRAETIGRGVIVVSLLSHLLLAIAIPSYRHPDWVFIQGWFFFGIALGAIGLAIYAKAMARSMAWGALGLLPIIGPPTGWLILGLSRLNLRHSKPSP